jgi:NTE family protein
MTMYPFRNLAFQGGGAKALAYHGAVSVLEQEGVLVGIERVAGTSAGATLATLLSMRLDINEIREIYRSFDVTQFNAALAGSYPTNDGISPRLWNRLQGNISSMSRLATRFGWNSLDYYYDWLQKALAPYCKNHAKATFAQYQEWGYRDLHIVTTNVSRRKTEVFNAQTTPNVAVVDALLISQSLPLFFEGLQFDGQQFGSGDYYADGGMILNYPLPIFDEMQFARNNRWFVNGINWESLGCRLYTPKDCPQKRESIGNLFAYLQSTFDTLIEAQAVAFELSTPAQMRTININDCCVRTIDFSIRPAPEDERYQELIASGKAAASEYLANYKAPLIQPLFPLATYFDRARNGLRNMLESRRQENTNP